MMKGEHVKLLVLLSMLNHQSSTPSQRLPREGINGQTPANESFLQQMIWYPFYIEEQQYNWWNLWSCRMKSMLLVFHIFLLVSLKF